MAEDLPPIIDLQALIERSQRRSPLAWSGYAFGMLLLLSLGLSLFQERLAVERAAMQVVSVFVIIIMLVGMTLVSFYNVRSQQRQRQAAEAIEELIQLRRWPEALTVATGLLSQAVQNPVTRARALLFLAPVLARYERFDDAVHLNDYLLESLPLDESTAFGVRLGRAMAMLRQDRLFDADRAINELRRLEGSRSSGGLGLVEMYRDVQTGHPDEALAIYEQKREAMRDQLGHRVADAHGLAAAALAALGREDEARLEWVRATLLSPVEELVRRYPELKGVAGRFPKATNPLEGEAPPEPRIGSTSTSPPPQPSPGVPGEGEVEVRPSPGVVGEREEEAHP